MYLRLHALLCSSLALAILLPCACAQTIAASENTPPAPYTPQVWDIDWSYLREARNREDWTDCLHYLQLGKSARHFLSITGQVRERGEYQDHPAFGAQPANNGYLLQRYLLSGDLEAGEHFRTFVQLDSGFIHGRDGGPRPEIDEDKLDFNQAFMDVTPWRAGEDASFTVRAGRQLVSLGSTRLIATGAGLNVEQPFDGFRLTLHAAGWTADGLAVRPTLIESGAFDNQPNATEELWGLYLTHPMPRLPRSHFDLYYLGFDHKNARYTQGSGRSNAKPSGRASGHTRPAGTTTLNTPASSGASTAATYAPGGLATTSDTYTLQNALRLILKSMAESSAATKTRTTKRLAPSIRFFPTAII